jgi:hypothetical protein
MKSRLIFPLALVVLIGSAACAPKTSGAPPPTPKVIVDTVDRPAYTAVRAFQVAEAIAYHTKPQLPWPSDAQHQQIGVKLGQAYTLIVDVANAGILLPPGGKLSVKDLAALSALTNVVADLVALAQAAPPAIQTAAAAAQTKAGELVTSVQIKGGL